MAAEEYSGARRGLRTRGALALLAVSLGLASCARIQGFLPFATPGAPRISEAELRTRLLEFAGDFVSLVSAAADEISAKTERRAVRKSALLWKIRAIPLVQEAAFGPDAQESYVSVFALAVVQRSYLTEGDGREIFGDLQPIAVAAATALEQEARSLGATFLTPAELERVAAQVDELARVQRMRGREFEVQSAVVLEQVRKNDAFAWIVNLPMVPVRALEGVSSTAAAVHEFNQTAQQFTQIVQSLPQQVRWQTELLFYDAEDRDTVMQGLAAFESLAQSAERASEAVERLPDDLRTALSDSQAALAQASGLLQEAQALAGPLATATEELKLAGDSWAVLFPPSEGEPEGRPFDIAEWESALREVGSSAAQLQSLAAELHGLVDSQQLGTALGEVSATVASAEASAEGVVDAAAWRGFQLLLAFFALLGAYRVLSTRLGKR